MRIFKALSDNGHTDERIQLQRMKILSQAYVIVMFLLIISMIIKIFVYDMSFIEYLTEFVAFFGALFYILLRMIITGQQIYSHKRKILLVISALITSIALTLFVLFNNFNNYDDIGFVIITCLITFLSSFIISLIIIIVINKLGLFRSKELEKKYDD